MKVLSSGKYECPYCGTVVELNKDDIHQWNSVYYYKCPCGAIPHISQTAFDNWLCPHSIKGKKAKRVN